MDILFTIGVLLIVVGFIAWSWLEGIDRMIGDHPDYRGEDLFDEVPKKKTEWDDNKQHTEQNFKI